MLHSFRKIISFLTILLLGVGISAQEFQILSDPYWVNPVPLAQEYEIPKADAANGTYYLMVDTQVFAAENQVEGYFRYAFKVFNHQGVESSSQLTIDFDPSYQELVFHSLTIHRDDQTIDQLDANRIEILQRERNLESLMYDGIKTASIILADIRVGDIVEYSYSIIGINPVFQNKIFSTTFLDWTIPIETISLQLTTESGRSLFFKNLNYSGEPVIKALDNDMLRYQWQLQKQNAVFIEDYIPDWYNPFSTLYISEFNQWSQVRDWGMGLFIQGDTESQKLKDLNDSIVSEAMSEEEKIIALISFVQKDIRYLGLEYGTGSYVPTAPEDVLIRRYGDCKDKVHLLNTLLDLNGVEACPVLVNNYLQREIEKLLPSPKLFNHVVSLIKHEDKLYYIDPTNSAQEGAILDSIGQLDFKRGLVLSKDYNDLQEIPINGFTGPMQSTFEVFDLSTGFDQDGILSVDTVYRNRSAENMRGYFTQVSIPQIEQNYMKFYSGNYLGVKMESGLFYKDQAGINEFNVKEKYRIPNPWDMEDGNIKEFIHYPYEISSYITTPSYRERSMPLALTYPIIIEQEVEVILPEYDWSFQPLTLEEDNKYFEFRNSLDFSEQKAILKYYLRTKVDYILPGEINDYLQIVDKLKKQMGYSISAGEKKYSILNSLKEW